MSLLAPLSRSLALGICLTAAVHLAVNAEQPVTPKTVPEKAPAASSEAAKPAPKASTAEKPVVVHWPVPTAAIKARAQKLSPDARKKLQAAIDENNARLRKAFEQIVAADSEFGAAPLSSKEPFFESPEIASSRERRSNLTGPSEQSRNAFLKLSEPAKLKLREHFTANREKVMKMSPEERKAYMDTLLLQISQEDKADGSKPAPESSPAPGTLKKPAAVPPDTGTKKRE